MGVTFHSPKVEAEANFSNSNAVSVLVDCGLAADREAAWPLIWEQGVLPAQQVLEACVSYLRRDPSTDEGRSTVVTQEPGQCVFVECGSAPGRHRERIEAVAQVAVAALCAHGATGKVYFG